jgi:hypothetical protein
LAVVEAEAEAVVVDEEPKPKRQKLKGTINRNNWAVFYCFIYSLFSLLQAFRWNPTSSTVTLYSCACSFIL